MLTIRYSNEAIRDLEEIFATIYKDYPNSAYEYLKKLKKRVEILAYSPYIGKECTAKMIQKDCRVFIIENYLVVYQIKKEEVVIQRFIHQRQNYKKGSK